jgi:hypothetical protein
VRDAVATRKLKLFTVDPNGGVRVQDRVCGAEGIRHEGT